MNTEIYVFLKKNELSLNNHLPSPNHLTEEYSNFCSSFMRYSLNLWEKKLTFLPTQIKFINNKSCGDIQRYFIYLKDGMGNVPQEI